MKTCLTSPGLSFLICKMGMIRAHLSSEGRQETVRRSERGFGGPPREEWMGLAMRRRSSQVEPEGSVHQNWGLNCLPLTCPPQCSSPSRGWAPVSWPQLTQPDIGHSSPSWRDSLELIRDTCLPRGPCSPSPRPWGERCQAPFRSSHNQGFGCSRGEDADHGDGVQEEGLLSSRSWAASPASLALEGGGDQPEGGS